MSHIFRFFGKPLNDSTWQLTGDEAHHFVKVLRLGIDEVVEVTDGRGSWVSGTVTSVNSREVNVTISSSHRADNPRISLELAIGALRPGVVDEILPMICELGIDRIHVFGQRGVAKTRLGPKVHERWERILLQSIKQCKRPWLPEVVEHESVEDLIAASAKSNLARVCLDPLAPILMPHGLRDLGKRDVLAIVGGEKGFDPVEADLLTQAGAVGMRLGDGILRAVTAAVAAATCLELHRQQL
jgi:16S rRNA (uracil1498-N3)-methyltransferase